MLKAEAERLGFDACGISRAERLDDEARRLEQWLHASMQASMSWMEDNFEKRIDPTVLVPGARSVVSVIENYYQPISPPEDPALGRVSRYAWGDDYHNVLKKKLVALLAWLSDTTGTEVAGRAFVDSAPVMDKVWAQRAGIGWIGKNANLLRQNVGSWFFLGELIIDVELEADGPAFDHCGSCTACIDACPTDAIVEPYVVDSNRCISYLTIEHREDDIDPSLANRAGNWIFGCDVCQEVCPWNKFRKAATEVRYYPQRGTTDTSLTTWVEVEDESFKAQYAGSPIRRAGAPGIRRNARAAIRNLDASGRPI
jgi:epoxyqueuosine reductase